MTNKQKKELEVWKYFMLNKVEPTDQDIKLFFEWSEKGKHRDLLISPYCPRGFWALTEGKRWADIHIGMYEEGVLDDSMPYSVIFEGMPKPIVEYMAKNMFKGMDRQLILEDLMNKV